MKYISLLDYYFFARLCRHVALVFLFAAVFFWVSLSLDNIATNLGVEGRPAFETLVVTILRLPVSIQAGFPFLLMAGLLSALVSLVRANEMTMLRVAGFSPVRLAGGLVLLILLLGGAKFFLLDPAAARLDSFYSHYKRHLSLTQFFVPPVITGELRLHDRLEDGRHIYLEARTVDPVERVFINPLVVITAPDNRFLMHIEAKKAKIAPLNLLMSGATVFEPGKPLRRDEDILLPVRLDFDKAMHNFIAVKRLTPGELQKSGAEWTGLRKREGRLKFHMLVSQPFLLAGVALIALSMMLTCRPRISGISLTVLKILAFLFFFILMQRFAQGASLARTMNPIIAVWVPVALSLAVGALSLAMRESP